MIFFQIKRDRGAAGTVRRVARRAVAVGDRRVKPRGARNLHFNLRANYFLCFR